MFETKKDDANLKIIDFGMAEMVPRLQRLKQKVGSVYYMAPEVIKGCYSHTAGMFKLCIQHIYCIYSIV